MKSFSHGALQIVTFNIHQVNAILYTPFPSHPHATHVQGIESEKKVPVGALATCQLATGC